MSSDILQTLSSCTHTHSEKETSYYCHQHGDSAIEVSRMK
jgi:hypothetical protein